MLKRKYFQKTYVNLKKRHLYSNKPYIYDNV